MHYDPLKTSRVQEKDTGASISVLKCSYWGKKTSTGSKIYYFIFFFF